MTLVVAPGQPRRMPAPELALAAKTRRRTPASFGIPPRWPKTGVATPVRKLTTSRVAWGYGLVSGMTGTTPASSGGGDSYGWMSETAEQRATEQKKRLGRLYVRGRAKRALERDHLVAGSSSAMSSRGDGFGHVRGGDYEHVGARRRERRGRRAHRGAHKKARWRFRSCRGRRRRRTRSMAAGEGDEGDPMLQRLRAPAEASGRRGR